MEQTIEQELINRLAQSLASIASNHIPLDQRLWDAEDCAQYLKMKKSTFQSHYACHPKFPKAIQLERNGGKSYPLWKASEVIKYALGK